MSRFLDERGRIFGRVNVVDILVFLVIVAVVVFAVLRVSGGSSETVPVKVTYAVEGVREATVNALEAKGTVRDDGGTVLGTVEGVTSSPTLEEFLTPDGQLKAFESPIYKTVNIVVLGQGQVSGSTVRIGSLPLRVGKKVTLVGTGYEVQTVIMDVIWGADAVK